MTDTTTQPNEIMTNSSILTYVLDEQDPAKLPSLTISSTSEQSTLTFKGTIQADNFVPTNGTESNLEISTGKWIEGDNNSIHYNKGSVGVGTTTPNGFQVDVPEGNNFSPGAGVSLSGGTIGNARIELRNNGTGTPYIDFAQNAADTDFDARIRLAAPGNLAIEGANLGVGTTTPNGFQVDLPEGDNYTPGAGVSLSGGTTGNARMELRNNGTGTPYIDFAQNASDTDFDARIRLTAPGSLAIEGANFGVGTTTPNGFQVDLPEGDNYTPGAGVSFSGGTTGNARMELRNNGTGTPYIDFAQNASDTDFDARIRLAAPGNLAIEGANLGIGTTTPNGFHVDLPEGDNVFPGAGVSLSGGTTGNARIELRNNGTGTPYIDFAQNASDTDFDARIRLAAPGKLFIEGASLGIDQVSPKGKLHITGDSNLHSRWLVLTTTPSDIEAKVLLDELPNNTLIFGGPSTESEGSNIRFYWRDNTGKKYSAAISGTEM